jgi:peptidoglycan/xylan/chitin deacetylase (PgdA/CDA1 family)
VKVVAAGADRLRGRQHGVVVLIYHRVGGGTASDVDLPAARFDDQMAALAASGRAIALADALDELARPSASTTREPKVVVTFDDGTADFVDVAVPILERHRVPATLYLATAFVEEQLRFPGDVPAASWQGLADACASGYVDIGSHTHRHRLLDRLAPAEIDDELDRSIGLVNDRLDRPAVDFAYPKAVFGSPAAQDAIRTRFRSAAVAGTRPNPYGGTDPYCLARSPIQTSDGMRWFEEKAAGGMLLEGTLRAALDRRRYTAITT